MSRPRAASIALAAVLALAVAALSACGGSSSDLLPGKTATQINSNLDRVRALVAEGDCAGAEDAVSEVADEVDGLGGVDSKLKAALRQGTNRLNEVVAVCGEEALAEAEAEAKKEAAAEAEQEEQEAVEAEEEELAAEQEQEEKAKEKAKKEAKGEGDEESEGEEAGGVDGEEGQQPPDKAEGVEKEEPPAPPETPGGTEPPAGGVGPGAAVE